MKKVFIALVIILVAIVGTGFWLKGKYESGQLQEQLIKRALPDGSAINSPLVGRALGLGGPRTYLVLFLNNTELRPGGGFIGSYAVVKMENGKPQILKVEGTEIIDNYAPGVGETPVAPLAKYLGIKTWQFRDSNWSPDFPTDAKLALQMYKAEHGLEADNISGVVALTPNIFEEILKIIGPVTVGNITFTSENFTETLEYEVEYGWEKRGVQFSERKKLLSDLSTAVLPRLLATSLTHWGDYMLIIPQMLGNKQIMLYSPAQDEQAFIAEQGWDGAMKKTDSDYLLWVDANLGALKTDVAIKRNLNYALEPNKDGYQGAATMHYSHEGTMSWRVTRYRDYVRVFVPSGSRLLQMKGASQPTADEGDENGYHWFGAFISIEPGHSADLSFSYQLPQNIRNIVQNGSYQLLVQKQLGTAANRLTLSLKFDKNLAGAEPAEDPNAWGDTLYSYNTDLKQDRSFTVMLAK